MRRHHVKGGSECPLTDQWYRLEQWSNFTLLLRRTYRDYINFAQKSCQVYSSVMYCMRVNLERRQYDRRHWRIVGDGRIRNPRQKAQCKGSVNANERWQFEIPCQRWDSQTPGGNRRRKPSTLIRDRPERGEEQEVFRGESDELSSPNPLQDDSKREDAEAKNDFWSVMWDFCYRHHVESRVKLYMPKEESFPIPLKYIDVTRTTHTSLDVLLEKPIEDYWKVEETENYQMHEQASQCSIYWTKGHLTDIHVSGRDWRGNKQPQDQTMYGQICGSMCLMHQRARQSKNGLSRNRSLTMPEDYVFFIEANDEEFKHTMWNDRRKLGIPMPAAMPCKLHILPRGNLPQYWETQDHIGLYCRWRRIYENTIGRCATLVSRRSHCCKRNEFIQALQFGTQIYANASSIKKNGCKNKKNLEKILAWQLAKVINKGEVIEEARNKGSKVHFASLMISAISRIKRASISKVQRQGRTPRWHCERWFRLSCSIHRARFICVTDDGSKSHGYHIQTARMLRTSSGRSIR